MVCDHCGSKTHRTGSSNCSKYCTLCKTPGYGQKSGSCPFRECSKCKAVGHSARECKPLTIMVCAHCGSETHRTNHPNCTKYCTMCKAPGHGQKSGSCRFRECSKCKEVGHSARECHLKNVRSIENDADGQTIHDANDKDADTCTMSVDGQSDDGNDSRKRSDSDRYKESGRSNLNAANASGHQNDENDDISDAGSEHASIAMDMEDESDIAKGGFGRRPARGIRARLSACGVLPPSAGL